MGEKFFHSIHGPANATVGPPGTSKTASYTPFGVKCVLPLTIGKYRDESNTEIPSPRVRRGRALRVPCVRTNALVQRIGARVHLRDPERAVETGLAHPAHEPRIRDRP